MSRHRLLLFTGLPIVLVILVAWIVFLWGAYYRHWEGPIITRVANAFPVPAAQVGSQTVLLRDYLSAVASINRYLSSEDVAIQNQRRPLVDEDRKNALEQLIEEAAVQELATARNVTVSDADVDTALEGLKSQMEVTSTSTNAFVAYVQDTFGWSIEDLKAKIVRPGLLRSRVAASYANDNGGDTAALNAYLLERLQRPDVVRYVKFKAQ